jgi:hypothetical protein
MTSEAPVRDRDRREYRAFFVALALLLHLLQVTPYLLTANLINRHSILPVLGAILLVALGTLALIAGARHVCHGWRHVSATDVVSPTKKPLGALATVAIWSTIAWMSHIYAIAWGGPIFTVIVALIAGLTSMVLAPFFLRTRRHHAPTSSSLALGIVLVLAAIAVLAGLDPSNLSDPWKGTTVTSVIANAAVTGGMIFGGTAVSLLRVRLTDGAEASICAWQVVVPEAVVAIELLGPAGFVIALNYMMGTLPAMLYLLPSTLASGDWTVDHWSLLWVGSANTAIALVAMTYVTNALGLTLSTALAQSRPILAKALQLSIAGTAALDADFVQICVASLLLCAASARLTSSRDSGSASL